MQQQVINEYEAVRSCTVFRFVYSKSGSDGLDADRGDRLGRPSDNIFPEI